MPISLKHINTSDSDTIKLDNVNYNFDQLVANGGGPRGPQGSIGQTGPQGTTGVQGFQGVEGNQGNQGNQGPISPNYWKNLLEGTIEAKTILPIHYSGDNFAPVVKIGYVEADSEYGTKSALVGGKTPYQWNINRRPYSTSNLRFLSRADADTAYDFKLNRDGVKDLMTMSFLNPLDSTTEYVSGGTSFRSSVGSSDSLYIDRNDTIFKKHTTFDSPVIIEDSFYIQNANEATGKVAISEDINGHVKFKDVKDLGGTVSVGTIVSIPPSIFTNNSNFVVTETVSIGNDEPLRIACGRGIGIYEGWYLCNGKTWADGNSFSYKVPQLGMFTYTIYDNTLSGTPNSQGFADVLPNSILAGVPGVSNKNVNHIHAGNGPSVYAQPNPGNSLIYSYYEFTGELQWPFTVGTGTTFKVKQLPQIIYLGKSGLKWTDQGTGQDPIVPLTFTLNDSNPFTNSPTTSKLSPNPYTLTSLLGTAGITVNNKLGGASLYSFESKVTAPSGYYWSTIPSITSITGLPSYATITSIVLDPAGSTAFPTSIIIEFSINPHPTLAPQQLQITVPLSINTTSLISSIVTPITISTTNPTNATLIGTFNTYIPSYNLINGYTFSLVYQANTGYTFIQANGTVPTISITENFNGIMETTGPAIVSFGSGNQYITIPMRLRDIPVATSATLQYTVNINSIWAKMPIITYNSKDASRTNYVLNNTFENTTSLQTVTQTVYNGTSKPIYIFVGIDQRWTDNWNWCTGWGPWRDCGSESRNFEVNAKWRLNGSTTNYLNANAPNGSYGGLAYWSSYYSINPGDSLTGILQQDASSDYNHTVELFWSFIPTDAASRTRFTYNLY